MTDTESSVSGSAMSLDIDKSVTGEEIGVDAIAMPPQAAQTGRGDEKLEEFSKLLKSIMESRSPSVEEAEGEGEDVEIVAEGINELLS